MSLQLVLPFCVKDGDIAIQNIKWMAELDSHIPFHCILSHDDQTPGPMIREMESIARGLFKSVEVYWYPAPEKTYWPAGANHAFQNIARYMAAVKDEPWLFLEADAIPIKKGWLAELAGEYLRGNRPFMGHVVTGMGHPNGVAIYPPMVALYSQGALMTQDTAWDVVIGHEVPQEMIHNANMHFMHAWAVNPENGEYWNGHGVHPTFTSICDIVAKIDLSACVFHRCKDGTLIHWLREFYKAPHKAMVPQLSDDEPVYVKTNHAEPERKLNPADFQGEWSAEPCPVTTETTLSKDGVLTIKEVKGETIVRDERPRGSEVDVSKGRVLGENGGVHAEILRAAEEEAFGGKCEIFIVTYGLPTKRTSNKIVSDFDWLVYALRCIKHNAIGFSGVTLAIPKRDEALLKEKCGPWLDGVNVKSYDEVDGKGMVQHMVVIGSADNLVPEGTEYVLHMDADSMFKVPTTPHEYVRDGKPVLVVRTYDSLMDSKTRVVSDCIQWKPVVESALRTPVTMYTMCRHPSIFPIAFYKRFRNYIKSKQGYSFETYVMNQRNEFPQTFAEFPTMGAFAYQFMRDKFHWIDISEGNHLAPKDKLQTYWSHGGLNDSIVAEIESYMKPKQESWKPDAEELERMAQ